MTSVSWERLPEEPGAAFRAFVVFRDMPPRDRCCGDAWRLMYPNSVKGYNNQFNPYCNKWKWYERAAAFDAYNDSKMREARERETEKDIAAIGDRRRKFRAYEEQLSLQGFRKVEEILAVATFADIKLENGDIVSSKDDKTGVPILRTQPNLLVAAATLFRTSSQIGRQALGIKDDEEDDVTPDQFKDVFFRTRGQMEAAMPHGAMPTIPEDINVKPSIHLSDGGAMQGKELLKPRRERPV